MNEKDCYEWKWFLDEKVEYVENTLLYWYIFIYLLIFIHIYSQFENTQYTNINNHGITKVKRTPKFRLEIRWHNPSIHPSITWWSNLPCKTMLFWAPVRCNIRAMFLTSLTFAFEWNRHRRRRGIFLFDCDHPLNNSPSKTKHFCYNFWKHWHRLHSLSSLL